MRMGSAIRRSLLPLAVVCLLAGGCGGGGGDGDPAAVIATVQGKEILDRDVQLLIEQWRKTEGAKAVEQRVALPEKRLKQVAILHLIKVTYVQGRADEEGVKARADELARATSSEIGSGFTGTGWDRTGFESAVRTSILSKALAEKLFPTIEVDDPRIRRYYDAHPEVFNGSWKATVDMAFFQDKPVQQIPGDADFPTLARQAGAVDVITDQPVNATSPLPPELLTVIPTMTVNSVSPPVQAGKGFWMIRARSIDHTPQTFDEARPLIETHLADQERQSRFDDWLTDELRAADITVAKQYGNWPADLL